ncbi:hypothetical protein DM450_25385 (plasmid) [Sphingomonas sp. IC081]|nr:hypothetical protein DM450_25385 [Sphingomonas sp. IC081]
MLARQGGQGDADRRDAGQVKGGRRGRGDGRTDISVRCGGGPIRSGRIDPQALGRARDAYKEVLRGMAAQIEAIMRDPSLTHDQKLAAVASLRAAKLAEAKAVRARIIAEAKAIAKVRRRMSRPRRGL